MTTLGTKVNIDVKMYIIANNFFMSKSREKRYRIEKMQRKFLHLIYIFNKICSILISFWVMAIYIFFVNVIIYFF